MPCHPSHKTRFSFDASTWDEICIYCGATDEVPGGWGQLEFPCPKAPEEPEPEKPKEKTVEELLAKIERLKSLVVEMSGELERHDSDYHHTTKNGLLKRAAEEITNGE